MSMTADGGRWEVVAFWLGIVKVNAVLPVFVFFQAEDGIRGVERSRGLGDVYKRQDYTGI